MIEYMEGVKVTFGGGSADVANTLRPSIRRMIEGMDVRSVVVAGNTTYRMGNGVEIIDMGGNCATPLREIVERHAKAIAADVARQFEPHRIDRTDAIVALGNGGERMLRQLARTASRDMRIFSWSSGETSVTPGLVRLEETPDLRMQLENGRISSYIRRGDQLWSAGSMLIGKDVQLPASMVAAIAGRKLDDIVSGTMLAGRDMTIRKAWNVGRNLGMTFATDIIDIHEALAMRARMRRAA